MIQSVISAKSAIHAQQNRVDSIANNIANMDTNGFKGSRVEFKDALYYAAKGPIGENNTIRQGSGALLSSTIRSFDQGTPVSTNVNLDFLIDGNGFFTVENAGELQYTRNGSFSVSKEDDGNYLVTEQGYYVMDSDLNRIKLPAQADQLSVQADGSLQDGGSQNLGMLNIVSFVNPEGLETASGNCYRATAASGLAQPAQDFNVRQGCLEGSNVDVAVEMTNLIRAQRAFSLASQSLLTAIQMEEKANSVLDQ